MLGIIAFILLLAIMAWQWTELQDVRRQLAAQSDNTVDPGRLAAMDARFRSLQDQIQAAAQKPAAAPVDLAPLEARLAALEQKPAPTPPPPPPPFDDSALKTQVQDLTSQIAALGEKLAAAQTQAEAQAGQAKTKADQAQAQADQAKAQADQLRTQSEQLRAAADQAKAQLAQTEAQVSQSNERAARAQQIDATTLALAGGHPLGSFPDAPPALQRFATAAPPTEASLRLSFEAAAKAAQAASDPAAGSTDVADRMWQRVQSLVTVRRGDQVLVGAPASVVLAEARAHLTAGDVAGAVAALDRLDAPAAKAMAGWRADAQALLDARAALASLVAGGPATP